MKRLGKTWYSAGGAIILFFAGCGQGAREGDGPELPSAPPPVVADPLPPAQPSPQSSRASLESHLDGHGALLPPSYVVQDLYISGLVSQFNDGSFNFDVARASDRRFAMEAFSLGRKVGGSYEEIFVKEVELWKSNGFLKCQALIEQNARVRAVLAADGRPAVEISVKVILTDVTEAVPSLKDSAFSRTLGYLMRKAHTKENPLKYNATIAVSQQGERFVVASHGSEGQELTPEVLQSIVRRNVMTLLSSESVALLKKATAMVLFPQGPRISLESLREFDREQETAREMGERERMQGAIEAAVKDLVDAVPKRVAGVRVDVALSRDVRDQLRHRVLDIGIFDAAGRVWGLKAAAERIRPGYSARQLARDAATVVQEFGVATVACDVEFGTPSLPRSGGDLRFPVTYRVVSVDAERPRAAASWIAAAAWAALRKQGTVTLEFPVQSKGRDAWRIGYALPTGRLLGRSDPVLAWGEPADVLSTQSVINAATRAIAESLAVDCERAIKEAVDSTPADRIQKNSALFGGIECLPEACPKEDGVDLALLLVIADEVDSGEFWQKRLPGVAAAYQEPVAAVLQRLAAGLKPKKWTSKRNEKIVASPVFLSSSHVVFDLGGGQQKIVVQRDACNDEGSRQLNRIDQAAVDSVIKINDAALSRAGVTADQADAAWDAVSKAVGGMVAANHEDCPKTLAALASVFVSLGSDQATESVRADLARTAAEAVKASADQVPTRDIRRLLEPFLRGGDGAVRGRPREAAYAEIFLAAGERGKCLDAAKEAIEKRMEASESDGDEYGRVAWVLGRALMADGQASQAVEWLRKAKDCHDKVRGGNALPPAGLLQELGEALIAAGRRQDGEKILKECRRVSVLTYGDGDSRVKQIDDGGRGASAEVPPDSPAPR